MLPLDGITVVALEQAVAAPFATRQLADLGARVIKIERADTGDFARGYDETVKGMSSYFVWLNRGKESVTLDIKEPRDRELLGNLLAHADVFVQNLIPGALARLELDEKTLRSAYPRLITCSISGYGADGPYRSKKAYDLLVQCETGLLSITGTPDSPAKAGISVADIAAGMYAYTGILTALYERERTGAGTGFEVSMLEALGEWTSQPYLYASYGGTPPPRTGARHASISPYGPYHVGDGTQVFIGVQNEREWAALCADVLGRPNLARDPRFSRNSSRVNNDAELRRMLEDALAHLSAAQVTERLDEVGIANARMRTMDEFADHPQLKARNRWREVDSPVGPVRLLLPPVTVTGREAAMRAIPAIGQQTNAIQAEFGPPGSAERGTAMTRRSATAGPSAPDTSSCTELITPWPAQALAALLDIDAPAMDAGLPALWHWIYLLDCRRQSDLGPDGHPTFGIPAPPGPGRLRMFAGGRVSMHKPLRFGELATRTTRVVRMAEKEGKSGLLSFVTVRSVIEQGGAPSITDEQDIVYREATGTVQRPRPPAGEDGSTLPEQKTGELAMTVNPMVLFRFSALTYNAHRIHYDQAYAATEGYPDLVVHGPLQALLMGECLRHSGVSMLDQQFAYRLVAPTYGAQRLAASFSTDGQGHVARVRDGAGHTTATATLQSRDKLSSPRASGASDQQRPQRPPLP